MTAMSNTGCRCRRLPERRSDMKREEQIDNACTNWICSQENGTVIMARNVWRAAVEWSVSHPNWIPVDRELPVRDPDIKSVSIDVIATDGNVSFESYYHYNTHEWENAENYGTTVTHWMPMPPAPGKEE